MDHLSLSRPAVLLLNWNGWADTVECLESVFRHVPPETRVIVCDNGSTDHSLDYLRAWAEGRLSLWLPRSHPLRALSWPPVPKPITHCQYDRKQAEQGGQGREAARLVLIDNGANLGFAGGNNVGLRYLLAQGGIDGVWLLNNDTVIAPGALEALLARMSEQPRSGMCGSTLLRYDRPQRVQARGGGWYCKWLGLPWHIGQLGRATDAVDRQRVERWMNYVVGASLCVSREFLEQVGLMTEDYFLYFEEADWARRARGRYALAFAPGSVVYHKVGRSVGTSSLPHRKSDDLRLLQRAQPPVVHAPPLPRGLAHRVPHPAGRHAPPPSGRSPRSGCHDLGSAGEPFRQCIPAGEAGAMKVTVVTINLDGNRFLPAAIDSVLSQDYGSLEYLLIDGGSTDGSQATIKAAAARDQRVSWVSGADGGISAAMNKGVAMATGDIVGFLHSDDCYPAPDVLATVAGAFAAAPEARWLTGGVALINAGGVRFRELPVRRYSYPRLVRSNILFHPATFVRTSVLRGQPFRTDLRLAMDYDLWLRLGQLGDPLLVDRSLASFRVHEGSRSVQSADAALDEEFAVRCRHLRACRKGVLRYRLEHLVKRIVNRLVIREMRKASLRTN